MKFKTIKVSSTKNIANKTGNRIAKQKLKEAAKDLNDVLKTAPESFVKIHLPEQKPSSIVKYLHASKPNARRSNRKLITSTPHLTNKCTDAFSITNKYTYDFSNAGSSTLSPIIFDEGIKQHPSSDAPLALDDESDSEVERPKFRNKKRTNCEPAPNCFPNKKRDPVDKIHTSSDIVFVPDKSDGGFQKGPSPAKAKSKGKTKAKKQKNKPLIIISNQSPSPRAELIVPLENVLSPPRDFVNKTPRSGGRVNFTKIRDDDDIEAWAKSIGLMPSPQRSDLATSSPKPRYDSRSSRLAKQKARTSTSFHEGGLPVARNLLDVLQAENSPTDVHAKIQEDKNLKSQLKQAKANFKHPPEAAIESESANCPPKKRKASKATKKTANVQSVGSSPKLKIQGNVTLLTAKENIVNQPVYANATNDDKIEEIEARKLENQMPAPPPPPPVEEIQVEIVSETSLDTSDDDQWNRDRLAFNLIKNFNETMMATRDTNIDAGPSTSGIHLSRPDKNDTQQRDQKKLEAKRKKLEAKETLWNHLCNELDSYAEIVTERGELLLSESSVVSKGCEELFNELSMIELVRKSKTKKQKIRNLNNIVKKLHCVKKNSQLVDRQIQTETLPAPVFRHSLIPKTRRSKSRTLNKSKIASKSPNIYDSLEQGNEIDALGFSNFDEPTLSFKHKPFRCDTPSRSLVHLSWSNSNVVFPNFSSDSDSSYTIENKLSPKPHKHYKRIKKYKNTTVASTNRKKSKLVRPNRILSSSESSAHEDTPSPKPATRSVARIIDQNTPDTNARKKLNFNKLPTGDVTSNKLQEKSVNQLQETMPMERETQANDRKKKSLEKKSAQQTHYDIILQAPQFDKEIPQASKKSNTVLKSGRGIVQNKSREDDVNDMLKSVTSIENLQQSPRNSNVDFSLEQQQQDRMQLDDGVSKRHKESSSKLNPLAEPFRSYMANEISGTKQKKSISKQKDASLQVDDNLRNSTNMNTEVPESSSKGKRQQKNSKQAPQNSTLEQVDGDSNLRHSHMNSEVPAGSSGKGRKQQNNSKQAPQNSTLEQVDIDNNLRHSQVSMDEVPKSSGKSRKQQNSSKQALEQVNASNNLSQIPGSSGKGRKQQKPQRKTATWEQVDVSNSLENNRVSVIRDNEVPESCVTSSKSKKKRTKSNLTQQYQSLRDDNGSIDIHMDNEILESSGTSSKLQNKNSSKQNSTSEPSGVGTRVRSSSCSKPNKENQTLEEQIPSSEPTSSTRGRKNNNNKKNQALEDKTESSSTTSSAVSSETNKSASKATEGKGRRAKREGSKSRTTQHIDESLILPEQDGRRQLRTRKPPMYCPVIDFATSIKTYSLSPKLFKKLSKRAAELVTSFASSQLQKGRTSRLTNQITAQRSSRIIKPIPEEPQDEQQNISDSILMPPPSTNLLRTRKDSVTDSGFAMSISVQKKVPTKSGKGRGGKRTTKTTKTDKKVPEPSCSVEPPTDSEQCTASSSMNESEAQSRTGTSSQISEAADSLYQTIDGKIFKTQFVCSQPSLLNYTSIGNLFVNEITKDPNNKYTVGYLRLEQGESKKVASSKMFSFVYVVITGVAEVTVDSKICTVNQGGYFWVPVGMTYSIKNKSLDSHLEINFTRIRTDIE